MNVSGREKKSDRQSAPETAEPPASRSSIGKWWLFGTGAFLIALLATAPTVGDFGLTWDEPAYRFSQIRSAQWWERLVACRSVDDLRSIVEPDALLFYWPYNRHGINFHPPFAGQLNLLSYGIFGHWMKDIPARRMASVLEFSLTITIGFVFLARRYGIWVGTIAGGTLLCMPRIYGQAHLIDTDITGLFLWTATSLAFWKGLHEPNSRRWRVLVGVLLGLSFLEKMAAIFVLVPILVWLLVARLPQVFRRGHRADWIDGLLTSTALLIPLVVAFVEILRLSKALPKPMFTNLFYNRVTSPIPGFILAMPFAVWLLRRSLAWLFPRNPVWGIERPALETWTAILAFAPVVGFLGNPSWWRETLPRFAHYYLINTDRRGSLPDIQILYFGQIYEYSLPWHNGWVLLAITVPALTLFAAVLGIFRALFHAREDRLPLYFLVQLAALPVFRMLPTPAHDGVRLFLPTFFFLAAFAGWGTVWIAEGLTRLLPTRIGQWTNPAFATLVIGASAWQLVKTHPYELSYYNELIGGPRGAWDAGFELTYWYDAFTPRVFDDLNQKFPQAADVNFENPLTQPSTFLELRSLGQLRADVSLSKQDSSPGSPFAYTWLLTQDSKSTDFTRLLFVMKPWYESRPPQLDGARVAAVIDGSATARAWFLFHLVPIHHLDPQGEPRVPVGGSEGASLLGRLWGEGLSPLPNPAVYEPIFEWAREDPDGLRAAAKRIARDKSPGDEPGARRLMAILTRKQNGMAESYLEALLRWHLRHEPEAMIEAVEIVIRHPDELRKVVTRCSYTDPDSIGGPLDEWLKSTAK